MTCLNNLLVLSCFFFFCVHSSAKIISGYVVHVHDGDTLTIKTQSEFKKIRLANIDAPELNQPFGIDSRDMLSSMVLNKQVLVDFNKSDKYSRLVGKVVLNSDDINLKQVQLGAAWVYREYLKEIPIKERALYLEAEHQSKAVAIGLWEGADVVEPWIWRKK
jgi:endonuclease YncB( thermonuclease family)